MSVPVSRSSPPHIYTLTGNLLAERTLDFASWQPGRTQRAQRETFQVGGKGINVSKMLKRLGVANTALGFAGGATGDECVAWLRERQLAFRSFRNGAPTRAGVVVRDVSGQQRETTFLGPDVPPDADAVRECADFLDAQPAGQVLALCGSFPGWGGAPFDGLRAALERWWERGILIADTYGPPLEWAMSRRLALVKLNADELRAAGVVFDDALRSPVRNWVVTDGPNAVRVRDEAGYVASFDPPKVREVSATGSGDVLLACVLRGWLLGGSSLRDAVKGALPYAAANAADPGIAEFADIT